MINKLAGSEVISVNGKSNLNDGDIFTEQNSQEAYDRGQEEFNQGYYDNYEE